MSDQENHDIEHDDLAPDALRRVCAKLAMAWAEELSRQARARPDGFRSDQNRRFHCNFKKCSIRLDSMPACHQ
jgi:hypothetical protein